MSADLGGDNRMQATPVEIYANVRRKAFAEISALVSDPSYGTDHLRLLRDILLLCDKEAT